MIKVGGILPRAVYAPELYALREYFAHKEGVDFQLVGVEEYLDNARQYDLLYRMMGWAPRWQVGRTPEIHDFASLSVGALPRTKNHIKRWSSRRPVLRSFLSDSVRREMGFTDDVADVIRDMGIPASFLTDGSRDARRPSYEFFYAGTLTRARQIDRVAMHLSRSGKSILLVGEPEDGLYQCLRGLQGVHFAGRVAREEIPSCAQEFRFGLNYTPDRYPFNLQTSTKVLEYCALGLPVVSNRYRWVQDFAEAEGGRFFLFDDMSSLDCAAIERFDFRIPDMSSFTWERVLDQSGIARAIQELRL